MTTSITLIRRLAFVWLAFCVAGPGGAMLACPPAVERDAEAETELLVLRDASGANLSRSHASRPAAVYPWRNELRAVAARSKRRDAPSIAARFLSLRTSETRIQV